MDIRSLQALQGYTSTKAAAAPQPSAVRAGAEDFAKTLAEGEAVAKEAISGKADPHALVHALAETQLAVETAVTVRDKVVEAYQEILRMPV